MRASLEAGSEAFERTPFGQEQGGPIRVEAEQALYTEDPAAFTFLGEVRAWRGQNILLAEQLRGEQATRELSAGGGVRTLWFSAPSANGSSGEAEPIEVASELLTYRQSEGIVVYSGKVRVEQASRVLTCRELSVELDDEGHQARKMTCRDDVLLVDAATDRQVLGDSAIYAVDLKQVEIFGDQVRLIDSQNNRLEGRYLLYDLDTGTVQIQSRPPQAGQS